MHVPVFIILPSVPLLTLKTPSVTQCKLVMSVSWLPLFLCRIITPLREALSLKGKDVAKKSDELYELLYYCICGWYI
ncbi:hypothetical protein L873DRAFT_1808366 [Choiromyces venosus 120613-1]|uniref:Uncharacterized protein n=1 Tax=Choiromyces venosus 120613-1 TaxID=1336337 RepID=A0A3N4JJF5_9PEZI|nr:hypothetical protein L873DRAFT_1808366 [Choiromyces venosus 120613-1]